MFCWFCSLNTVIIIIIIFATDAWYIWCTNKIYTYVLKKSYFIFPITKGSVDALMKLAGFNISNKVKNHWYRGSVCGRNRNVIERRSGFNNVCVRQSFMPLTCLLVCVCKRLEMCFAISTLYT